MSSHLKLIIPRRHILAVLPATFREKFRPRLQFVAFQKLPKAVPDLGKRGDLVTVATNGQILIAANGGSHEGPWPRGQTVLVHWSQLPRTKRRLGGDVYIDVPVTGKGGYQASFRGGKSRNPAREVIVNDTPKQYDPDKVIDLERSPTPYPNWIKVVEPFMDRKQYPISNGYIPVNARLFAEMTRAFELFQHARFGHRMNLSLLLRPSRPGAAAWEAHPVAYASSHSREDDRQMLVLLMGLRML